MVPHQTNEMGTQTDDCPEIVLSSAFNTMNDVVRSRINQGDPEHSKVELRAMKMTRRRHRKRKYEEGTSLASSSGSWEVDNSGRITLPPGFDET